MSSFGGPAGCGWQGGMGVWNLGSVMGNMTLGLNKLRTLRNVVDCNSGGAAVDRGFFRYALQRAGESYP